MTCSIILFVQSLKTPKLQDQQRNELEGKITLVECKVVLRTLSSGKSPGEDGFTWEFDNCSFDLLGQDLVNCFNEAYVKGEMSISPGEDGFRWEFYNCFFDLPGQVLVNCFNEAYVKGKNNVNFAAKRCNIFPPKRRLKPPKACKLASNYVAKC